MNNDKMRFVGTITGDGTLGPVQVPPGAPWSYRLSGTFDGATVEIQLGDLDGSGAYVYAGDPDGSMTESGGKSVAIPANRAQWVTTSSGASTDIDVFISR